MGPANIKATRYHIKARCNAAAGAALYTGLVAMGCRNSNPRVMFSFRLLFFFLRWRCLGWRCRRGKCGHITPGNFNPDLFGNFNGKGVFIEPGDSPIQSAVGYNPIALAQFTNHSLVFFRFFLLRSYQQEIKDHEHQDQWNERCKTAGPALGAATTLSHCICYTGQNQVLLVVDRPAVRRFTAGWTVGTKDEGLTLYKY